MTSFDDKQQKRYLELLDTVPVDRIQSDTLEKAAKRLQQSKIHKKRLKQSFLAVALLFLAIIGSIRVSPAVAHAISQLPGLKPFVELVTFDKGIEDILHNDYFEVINESQTIDGLTLTVTGVIADETGMSISYKIESAKDLANTLGVTADLRQGQELVKAGVTTSWFGQAENTFEVENIINVTTNEGMDYSIRDFELILSLRDHPETVFTIPFTLKNEIMASKVYPIEQQLVIDGQKIMVHELKISPLRSELKMSIDPSNTKKILNFGDIRLYDEKHEEWGKIKNGVVGFGSLNDAQFSVLLESNYFRMPKILSIEFLEIEAIDKKDAFVTIDLEKKQVIAQPPLLQLELKEIKDDYELIYEVSNYKKNEFKQVLGNMIDAQGTSYSSYSEWFSQMEDSMQIGKFFEVDEAPVNPVQLEIIRYEAYLNGKGTIQVDLD